MQHKNKLVYIALIIAGLFLVTMGIINRDTPDFWKMSFFNIVTIAIAIYFAFYLVQRQNDKRARIDKIEKLLNKIQVLITKEESYKLYEQDKNNILISFRSLSNKLEALTQVGKSYIAKEDIVYLSDQFQTYRELHGNHVHSNDELKTLEMDFKKHIANIDDKIDQIIVKLLS